MEYALLTLYYGFQKLFNTFLGLELVEGVTVGGIIIAIIILSVIFASFGFISSAVDTNVSKSRKSKEE